MYFYRKLSPRKTSQFQSNIYHFLKTEINTILMNEKPKFTVKDTYMQKSIQLIIQNSLHNKYDKRGEAFSLPEAITFVSQM